MGITRKLYLASSNAGKLREYQELAKAVGQGWELALLPTYHSLSEFEETAATFAENAAGKAMYYSRGTQELVFADDSGLVVPALGGAPGVYSARYAGPGATNEQKIAKLLDELRGKKGAERAAHFVCVIAAAREGRVLAVVSGRVEGEILEQPRGEGGFGYDPAFLLPSSGKSFAELEAGVKNLWSHRSKAFRRLLEVLT